MRIISGVVPGVSRLAGLQVELSKKARQRLKWFDPVRKSNGTHAEEFYEATESSFDLSEPGDELLEWEQVYNTVRPHQALGYMTPLKFLEQWKAKQGKEVMCH